MPPLRTILHADMDAFYAAVEQRDHPELRGRPVVVGGSGPRQVVATASYEARAFGVHSAMPGVRAKQLCPQAVFVRPRMAVYEAVSREVQAVFAGFTDRIEPLSLDEAFLDATGSEALFGNGRAIGEAIREQVLARTQLTVSVGVATSKFVAKVASDLHKPDGLVVVPPGEERAFLADLPVSRLWGVGARSEPLFHARSLHTIGDVQRSSLPDLVRWFGESMGQHVHELAHGNDTRPVEPDREAQSIGHELTFAEDLATVDDANDMLLQLAEQVGRRLRQHAVQARTIRIKVRYPDFTTFTRQRTVEATHDDLELHRVAVELLRSAWKGRPGLRLLGLTGAQLQPLARRQASLFGNANAQRDRLLSAMDAIRDRHGEDAVRRGGGRRDTTPWGPGV